MDIDNIKGNWKRLEVRVDGLDQTNLEMSRMLASQKIKSARGRLVRHYLMQALLGLVVLPLLGAWLWREFGIVWISVFYISFGALMGCLALWLGLRLRNLDYISLPTEQSLTVMLWIRRTTQWIQCLGIVLGSVLIISMFVSIFRDDAALVTAGIGGLVIGVIIGVVVFLRKRRLSNEIIDELKALHAED